MSLAPLSPSRLFPAPPLHVRVSIVVVVSRRFTSRSSWRRPTKLVSSAGRLDALGLRAPAAISASGYALRVRPRRELRLGQARQRDRLPKPAAWAGVHHRHPTWSR